MVNGPLPTAFTGKEEFCDDGILVADSTNIRGVAFLLHAMMTSHRLTLRQMRKATAARVP